MKVVAVACGLGLICAGVAPASGAAPASAAPIAVASSPPGVNLVWPGDLRLARELGWIAYSGSAALGPQPSHLLAWTGLDQTGPEVLGRWLSADRPGPQMFTVGYAWQRFSVEGSATTFESGAEFGTSSGWHYPSRSARFSIHPFPGLSLQFSRGMLDGADRVLARNDQRRTSLSARYVSEFTGGEWQTTFAWGRYSERHREPVFGYLVETSVRFRGAHLAFGRLEQVARDELPGVQQRAGKAGKLTIGYYQDVYRKGRNQLGAGIMASRYLDTDRSDVYGKPSAYMVFMKLGLE